MANIVHLKIYTLPVCFVPEKMLLYDDVDEEIMRCYHEMSLANLLYYAMKEGACSEQSSRMTAMDSASKNAGKSLLGESGCKL